VESAGSRNGSGSGSAKSGGGSGGAGDEEEEAVRIRLEAIGMHVGANFTERYIYHPSFLF